MKKLLKVGLVLFMSMFVMITLVGCGEETESSGEETESNGEETENNEEEAHSGRSEVIKIIVPYGVGGTADAIGRRYGMVAGKLYPEYEFVVEQKTGGDGFVGAVYFENVDPDAKELFLLGYGLAYRHELGKTYNTEEVPFDLDAFKPLAYVDDRTWILYGNPGDTLEGVIEKAQAGTLLMSGGNPLSDPHLALGALLAIDDGEVTVVGYEGGAAQKQGLVSGEIDVFIGTTQAGSEEIEVGSLIPLVAFSENGYDGFVDPEGPVSVPGLVDNKHAALDPDKDYSGSIVPAGGFLAGHTGMDQEWADKVIEITKAVWNEPEYHEWIEEIGLNRVEVYGDDAQAALDAGIVRAVEAFKLLSGE
jgi:tripartite-type tricarboxylate transporter receptor subunit TctC